MEKKRLRDYSYRMGEIRVIDRQIGEWRTRAGRCTSAPDKPATVGGSTDPLPHIMDNIIRLERKMAKKLEKLADFEKAVEGLTAKESLLMRLYYADGLSWIGVADVMGYSIQRVYQLHGDILRKINAPCANE